MLCRLALLPAKLVAKEDEDLFCVSARAIAGGVDTPEGSDRPFASMTRMTKRPDREMGAPVDEARAFVDGPPEVVEALAMLLVF